MPARVNDEAVGVAVPEAGGVMSCAPIVLDVTNWSQFNVAKKSLDEDESIVVAVEGAIDDMWTADKGAEMSRRMSQLLQRTRQMDRGSRYPIFR